MKERTLAIGQFKKSYMDGRVIDATSIDSSVHFVWDNGDKGRIVMCSGDLKVWPSNTSALSYLRILDLERDMLKNK